MIIRFPTVGGGRRPGGVEDDSMTRPDRQRRNAQKSQTFDTE